MLRPSTCSSEPFDSIVHGARKNGEKEVKEPGGGRARKKITRSNRPWEARRRRLCVRALARRSSTRETGDGVADGDSVDFFHRRREVSREVTEFTPWSVIYTRRSGYEAEGVATSEPEEGQKGRAVQLARGRRFVLTRHLKRTR